MGDLPDGEAGALVRDGGNVSEGCGRKIGPYDCCTIVTGDAKELAKAIPDKSVDAVIMDPPYGLGLAEWDSLMNPGDVLRQTRRILQPNGFLAFFCQMPTMIEWAARAEDIGFTYAEHIAWVKRATVPSKRLVRCHENILIYRLDRASFYSTAGPYEDVRVPGLQFDVITIDAIQRQMAFLRQMVEQGKDVITSKGTAKRQPAFRRFAHRTTNVRHARLRVNFSNVWSFQRPNHKIVNGQYRHPAEKPILIMERLIEMLAPFDGLIVDLFLGSGTTTAAAKQLGYHSFGFEIDPEVAERARERVRDTQPPLFVVEPEQTELELEP